MTVYTTQQLLEKISGNYSEESQTFSILKNTFQGPIEQVLNLWVSISQLVINGVVKAPSIEGNTIIISGTASFLNTANRPVILTLGLLSSEGEPASQGEPYLVLEVSLPYQPSDKWSFGSSFKTLANSPLDQIEFQKSTFWLSSTALASHSNIPTLQAGLNFQSLYATSSDQKLSLIMGILGNEGFIELSGLISIARGTIQNPDNLLPKFDIQTNSKDIGISSFLSAPIQFGIISRLAMPGDPVPVNTPYVSIGLTSSISIGSSPAIDLFADLTNIGRTIVFGSQLAQFDQYAISELQQFMNNEPLTQSFSSLFNIGNFVLLKTVKLFIATQYLKSNLAESLVAISIEVETPDGKTWPIVKNVAVLNNLDFTFMLNYPSTQKELTVIIDGIFNFGNPPNDVMLLASGSFPDGLFSLNSCKPFSLSTLLAHFMKSAKGFPELTCDNLAMTATPNEGPYSFYVDITSTWDVSVGVCDINLCEASLQIDSQKENCNSSGQGNSNYSDETTETTGTLMATANILPKSNPSDVITMTVNWNLPGDFQLKGNFPDINLTSLSKKLAGVANLSLPPGFPQINLTNAVATLTIQESNLSGGNQEEGNRNSVYDFSLNANVEFNNEGLGLVFELQGTSSSGFGVIAGIWTENWSWSPANQWPDIFGTILHGISFSHAGLLVSSIKDATVSLDNAPTTIPSTVQEGLTFFCSIGLSGPALSLLNKFFPGEKDINFYGVIADPLIESKLIGRIGKPSSTSKYSFNGLEFIANIANETFSIQTGVSFTFNQIAGPNKGESVTLDFVGGGTIGVEPPEFSLYFVFKTDGDVDTPISLTAPPSNSPGWKDPLGINGLIIDDFWGEVGIEDDGLTFGFGGTIDIGEGVNQALLELDIEVEVEGEVPILDVFRFVLQPTSNQSIMIVQLIKEFTSLNLTKVPILNSIGLKDFEVFLIMNPAGWTSPATLIHYPAGFFTEGDVTFYGFEAKFKIEIDYAKGIIASGSISKALSLADGIVEISDAQDNGKGPYGSIDTTAVGTDKPYLTLSGKLKVLDISDSLYAYVDGEGFKFQMNLGMEIFTASLDCELVDGKNFTGTVSASIGLNVNIPNIKLAGITIIPAFHLDASLGGSITATINPGFTLSVAGSFTWGSFNVSASFNLITITSWHDLESEIANYFVKYPEKIFKEFTSDVSKWVKAVKQDLIKGIDDVANVLKNAFDVAANDAAKFLSELGYATDEIVNDLKSVWDMTEDEAEKIVSGLSEACAIMSASNLL